MEEDISLTESMQYDFDNIRNATDDFSEANKLGQGGFGTVYKVCNQASNLYLGCRNSSNRGS